MDDIKRLYNLFSDEDWKMVAENGGSKDHSEVYIDYAVFFSGDYYSLDRVDYEVPVLRYDGNDVSYEEYAEEPIPEDFSFSEADYEAAKEKGRFEALGHTFYRVN